MISFFDKLEDIVREHLSRFPITYSVVGGIAVVLFWRSVWETADMLAKQHPLLETFFYPPFQILFSIAALLITGLMVSVFIGDRIILSGLRHEKKLEEKTEELVEEEVVTLKHLHNQIKELHRKLDAISSKNPQ